MKMNPNRKTPVKKRDKRVWARETEWDLARLEDAATRGLADLRQGAG